MSTFKRPTRKSGVLRGPRLLVGAVRSTDARFPGLQLTLDGMRADRRKRGGWRRPVVVPVRGARGFAMYMQERDGPRVWLSAERSKRVRIFKQLETAVGSCRALGCDQFIVRTDADAPPVSHAKPGASVGARELEEHV